MGGYTITKSNAKTKFSILIPTYNRPELVHQAVESVLKQSYENFEILLLDNGSIPALNCQLFTDPRIRFFRNEENIEPSEAFEKILNEMCGTHFIFLSDDDALVPTALEIVKENFELNPDIEFLGTSYVHYDHNYNILFEDDDDFKNFSGKLELFDARETLLFYLNNSWGIGERKKYKGPKMSHPSACFLKKVLIDKTKTVQKELFIKTFGDVGYLGTLFYINTLYYLNLPLSIIGHTSNSDSMGIQLGKRMKTNSKYLKNLEYTPIKGMSFVNIAVDTHLRVIYRNNKEGEIDCKLNPQFFFRHLESVISDVPWTKKTLKDAFEVIPYLLISLIHIRTFLGLLNTCFSGLQLLRTSLKRLMKKLYEFTSFNKSRVIIITKIDDSELGRFFPQINDAAKWVNENYIQKYWKNKSVLY